MKLDKKNIIFLNKIIHILKYKPIRTLIYKKESTFL
jgi:hypothetical protein